MQQSKQHSKRRRSGFFALLAVLGFPASCATSEESTGSESHFVRCHDDTECPLGTCEAGYCVYDGHRYTAESLAAGLGDAPTGTGDLPPSCLELSRTPSTLAEGGTSAESLNVDASATLRWDGRGWGDSIAIEPLTGETEIRVTLTVAEDSVERVERTQNPERGGTPALCQTLTEFRMDYRITTADGSLDESGTTTHSVGELPVAEALSITLGAADLQGSLRIAPANDEAVANLTLALWWPEQEFSGNLALGLSEPGEGGSVNGSQQGTFGSFSTTGCAVQQWIMAADDRFGQNTVAEEVALAEQERTLQGVWSDNDERATLTVATRVNAEPYCRSATELPFNGTLTLSSDDGRFEGLELAGSGRWWLPTGDDTIASRSWSGSATLECANTEPWPLTVPACSAGRQGVSVSYSSEAYDVLEIYVYDTSPVSAGAAADSVVRFTVAP